MKLFKLKSTTGSDVALKYLKMRYPDFFELGKISEQQMLKLIEKLKEFLKKGGSESKPNNEEIAQRHLKQKLAQLGVTTSPNTEPINEKPPEQPKMVNNFLGKAAAPTTISAASNPEPQPAKKPLSPQPVQPQHPQPSQQAQVQNHKRGNFNPASAYSDDSSEEDPRVHKKPVQPTTAAGAVSSQATTKNPRPQEVESDAMDANDADDRSNDDFDDNFDEIEDLDEE